MPNDRAERLREIGAGTVRGLLDLALMAAVAYTLWWILRSAL